MAWPKLWPLGIICLPIIALFGPALSSDASFAMRDAAHYYYPLFEWTTAEWAAGRVPLWNPYENCGVPVVADATASVFYPGKLIFALPLDFALCYKLYIVAHVFVAAFTSYLLARRWGQSHPAAGLAAVAYSCGGSVVFQYCNVVFLVGAAWLPLALLAIDGLAHQSRWRSAILLAATLSLMVLGGDPQSAFHAFGLAALYGLVLATSRNQASAASDLDPNKQSPPSSRHQTLRVRELLQPAALLVIAALFAFLLSAVQLLPSLEATGLSERAAFHRPRNIYEAAAVAFQPANDAIPPGESTARHIARGLLYNPPPGSHHDRVYDFSVGPWRVVELIWPNIGGRMLPTNRRWMSLVPAEGRVWSPTLYLGLFPVVLTIAAFFRPDLRPRLRWLRWTAVLFTVGGFGYYGLGWLLQEMHLLAPAAEENAISPAVGGLYWLAVTLLPSYAYFRYPAKLLVVAALAMSQLAASGLDDALSRPRPRLGKALLSLFVFSIAGASLLWFFGGPWFDRFEAPDTTLGPFDASGARHDTALALLHTAVVALAAAWLLWRAWKFPPHKACYALAALLLTAIELTAANSWLVFTAPADIWRNDSPITLALRNHERGSPPTEPPLRVYRGNLYSWRPPQFGTKGSSNRLSELAEWERDTLFPKYPLHSGIALVESYGSLKSTDYESLLFVAKQYGKRQPDKSIVPNGLILRLLGTTWLVLPRKHLNQERPSAPWPASAELSRLSPDSPRAWVVHDLVVMPPLSTPRRMFAVDKRTTDALFPAGKVRDWGVEAVVETAAPLPEWASSKRSPRAVQSASTSHITHYDPQYVVIEAYLTEPGLVVLNDSWFPGWRAYVSSNGSIQEATIHRVNRVQRGIWLPAGQHVVEYYYDPWSFYVGAVLSGIAWPFLGTLCLFVMRRRNAA